MLLGFVRVLQFIFQASVIAIIPASLEHLKKFCSHPVRPLGSGLFGFWLRFRSVTGHYGHAPSLKPCQKPKILAPHNYTISGKALLSGLGKRGRQEEGSHP